MTSLSLYSERYGASGNIGENFRRLLGAPSHDALQTLIRESLQNISDAAKLSQGPEIEINIRSLDRDEKKAIAEKFFSELPTADAADSRARLQEFLGRDNPIVLEICDFNTIGLAGPVRADRIRIEDDKTDFIDFLRNIGTPRDTHLGGGTYGFGKVSLYRMSQCSSIIVDTQVHRGQRRLIGCHIGKSFRRDDDDTGYRTSFTGRHWWGVADETGFVDPLVGDDARALASEIGFPDRDENRSGTSIMILDADLDDNSLEENGKKILEAVMWNFWPRLMTELEEERRFSLRINVCGKAMEIPKPEDIYPFKYFCDAMTAVRKGKVDGIRRLELEEIRYVYNGKPKEMLGRLAVKRGVYQEQLRDNDFFPRESVIPGKCAHIALMRPVELVVKYVEGTPSSGDEEFCGVFMSSDEDDIERAFADAEPPAHDDWVPDNLPNRTRRKTYVRQTLERIRYKAKTMANGRIKTTAHDPGTVHPSLPGAVALLARVLSVPEAVGVTARTKSKRSLASGLSVQGRGLMVFRGKRTARFELALNEAPEYADRSIRLIPLVMLDSGAMTFQESRAIGCDISVITGADIIDTTDEEYVIRAKSTQINVHVTVPEGCTVKLDAGYI